MQEEPTRDQLLETIANLQEELDSATAMLEVYKEENQQSQKALESMRNDIQDHEMMEETFMR